MKKVFSCFLIAVLLLSFGLSGCSSVRSAQAAGSFDMANAKARAISGIEAAALLGTDGESAPLFGEPIDISALSGAEGSQDANHSGHQTRIVHTDHGDYIAYLSDCLRDYPQGSNLITMHEFSIIKVVDGEATILYQDYQSYCTSSISIFQDENGEVYASTMVSNKFNSDMAETGVGLAVWHVDSKTDEVTGYKTVLKNKVTAAYGYAQPIIDTVNNKIYTVISRGYGDNDGWIHWCIFDLDTMRWEPDEYMIRCHEDFRFTYHFGYADGKGGMILVNERTALAENAGHPEIPSSPVWPADYVWDGLGYYYIPNVYDDSEFYFEYVQEPDYSRVVDLDGDGKYTSMEERETNQYPTVCNNHHGDVYIDSDGLLHVLYTIYFHQDALDRSVLFEVSNWHVVMDISDPKNPVFLSKEELFFEGKDENPMLEFEFRMTESTNGTLYIVAANLSEEDKDQFLLYELAEKEEGGYNYNLVGRSGSMAGGRVMERGHVIANNRSISVVDNTVSILWTIWANGSYNDVHHKHDLGHFYYTTLTLPVKDSLAVTNDKLDDAVAGEAYQDSVDVSYNGSGTLTYSAEGLPEGLSIDGATGVISGTPAAGSDTGSPYTVKVTVTDGKLTATQELSLSVRQPDEFVITVIKSKGGMVLPVGGKITVMKGENKSFVFVADSGYRIADVLVDGKSVGVVTKYTFENVAADHTLQVKFQKRDVLTGEDPFIEIPSDSSSTSSSDGNKDNVNTGAAL